MFQRTYSKYTHFRISVHGENVVDNEEIVKKGQADLITELLKEGKKTGS